jgi:2-methylcitrate dehydratase PrpD
MENTRHVIDYIVGSRFGDIPSKALTVAKGAMLDCVGVALAGARQTGGMIPRTMGPRCRRGPACDRLGP